MPLATKTAYAILGMLSREPRSGYDIKKEIEDCISYFWSESYGQIYKVLKALEKKKLVVKKPLSQKKGPTKHIYAVTPLGRDELKRYLEKPAQKLVVREELILKLFFGENISPERNVLHLEEELKNCETKLKEIKKTRMEMGESPSKKPSDAYQFLLLDLGKAIFSTKSKWCKKSITRLKKL